MVFEDISNFFPSPKIWTNEQSAEIGS